jgi:hypothetical protein
MQRPKPVRYYLSEKIDPVVTRAPPGMQNMSKNMAKMST